MVIKGSKKKRDGKTNGKNRVCKMNLTNPELDRMRTVGKVPYEGTNEKNCECVVRQDLVYFF